MHVSCLSCAGFWARSCARRATQRAERASRSSLTRATARTRLHGRVRHMVPFKRLELSTYLRHSAPVCESSARAQAPRRPGGMTLSCHAHATLLLAPFPQTVTASSNVPTHQHNARFAARHTHRSSPHTPDQRRLSSPCQQRRAGPSRSPPPPGVEVGPTRQQVVPSATSMQLQGQW